MSLPLPFDSNIKPRGAFSTIVKEYDLLNKKISFTYQDKTYEGLIIKKDYDQFINRFVYGIRYDNKVFPSTTSWCVYIKQQVYIHKINNNEPCSMKKEPRSARGPELCYVEGICFNTYRKMFATTYSQQKTQYTSKKSFDDFVISKKVTKIQKITRGWLIRKKMKKQNNNFSSNEKWFNNVISNNSIIPKKYDWFRTISDLFKISIGVHNNYHFRMEKNYQNILLYYLKQLPKYNFIEEVVTPLQFIGNCGVTIQMSGNQSSRYDLWDPVKYILMELKFCPNGLKDKEREQIKIYMEQRRMFNEHWDRTIGFLVNFANNFEFELYYYEKDKLQLITITNLLTDNNKQYLKRPYITINKIC